MLRQIFIGGKDVEKKGRKIITKVRICTYCVFDCQPPPIKTKPHLMAQLPPKAPP